MSLWRWLEIVGEQNRLGTSLSRKSREQMRYKNQRRKNLGLVRSPLRVPAVYFYLIRKGCCCCSVAKLYMTLWLHGLQHARPPCPAPSPRVCPFMSMKLVMLSNHFILCHPLLLLPSIFSSIRVFSNESAVCHRWPKYWSFSFSISPSNEYSGLISLTDGLDLLAVQGKSHLQHNLKASILQCSAYFMV